MSHDFSCTKVQLQSCAFRKACFDTDQAPTSACHWCTSPGRVCREKEDDLICLHSRILLPPKDSSKAVRLDECIIYLASTKLSYTAVAASINKLAPSLTSASTSTAVPLIVELLYCYCCKVLSRQLIDCSHHNRLQQISLTLQLSSASRLGSI